jgi:hypothetical protein
VSDSFLNALAGSTHTIETDSIVNQEWTLVNTFRTYFKGFGQSWRGFDGNVNAATHERATEHPGFLMPFHSQGLPGTFGCLLVAGPLQ